MIQRKDRKIKYLVNELIREGVCQGTYAGVKKTVEYWIKHGKLKLRKQPGNGYQVVNIDEAREIVFAFGPKGRKKWEFDPKDQAVIAPKLATPKLMN